MSDIAKMEAMLEKETGLYLTHKEKADRLRQKIDEEKGQAIIRSVKGLNLSPEEFKRFQKALEDKGNVRKLIQGMPETRGTAGGETPDGIGTEPGKNGQGD